MTGTGSTIYYYNLKVEIKAYGSAGVGPKIRPGDIYTHQATFSRVRDGVLACVTCPCV